MAAIDFKKTFAQEDKIYQAKMKMSVRCKCGHRVCIHAFNKRGYAICSWCGTKVNSPKLEFKEKLLGMIKEK